MREVNLVMLSQARELVCGGFLLSTSCTQAISHRVKRRQTLSADGTVEGPMTELAFSSWAFGFYRLDTGLQHSCIGKELHNGHFHTKIPTPPCKRGHMQRHTDGPQVGQCHSSHTFTTVLAGIGGVKDSPPHP